jgi:preprotein translocase subunit YajC
MGFLKGLFADLPLLIGAPEGAAGGASSGGAGGMLTMLLPFALIIGVFYFLIIRPQSKKQKETKAMLSSLRKNDRVATIGGIRGTIVSVKEDTVIVKVDNNVKMEFSKSAISAVVERKDSGGGKSTSGKESKDKPLPEESSPSDEPEGEAQGDSSDSE